MLKSRTDEIIKITMVENSNRMNFIKILFKKRISIYELAINILLKCWQSHQGLFFGLGHYLVLVLDK